MSAKNIPIEFPQTSTATEQGDGVLIHWTCQPRLTGKRLVVLCATVESTRTVKRMTKYLREEGR
jgi:hypothetical protein